MVKKMGKYELKHRVIKKRTHSVLSVILAVCTLLMCITPASASVITESSSESISEGINESSLSSEIAEPADEANNEALLANENEQMPVAEEDGDGDGETEEPQTKKYTVTFDYSPFGIEEELVEEYGYPTKVPEIDVPAAKFIGWYLAESPETYINPAYTQVTADVTYKAKIERKLEEVIALDDEEHAAFMGGFDNGMFRPSQGLKRSETAQIFYTLLASQDYDVKRFSDVSSSQWYQKAVGVMATLGVIGGYTDGTFRASKTITRAEFAKMAASLDELEEADVEFTDVKTTDWAYPYIASAVAKGWISGYTEPDGSKTFRPGNPIKRSEAAAIVNRMLGRYAPSSIKSKKDVKNFYDVFATNWAYADIIEASTPHTCSECNHETSKETWETYETDTKTEKSRWFVDGNDKYYIDGASRKFKRGSSTIDGIQYLLDDATGKAFTGWKYVGSWKRYYKQGRMLDDISREGVVSGPYFIKVYKQANYLIVFAKDGANGYTIPVKAMITSCGYGTPTGTYYTPNKYRWLRMEGYTWAQWCTQISGNYLFHSVPNWTYSNMDLEVHEYNLLGSTRSMGCIRLTCVDAKWIYDNCSLGTYTFISAVETSGPLAKPTSLKIPSWHTWDPTDPTAYYKCQQRGCH